MEKGADRLISEIYNKSRIVAMLAPSFVAQFDYPQIITQLKELGVDKVVELTFGAKMVNREYHRLLKGAKKLLISSACPGIVETIRHRMPEYRSSLMPVDSPMIAMAKICKKFYQNHLTLFVSPCIFKKIEAMQSEYVDIVIGYNELEKLFEQHNIIPKKTKKFITFDKFYNDYTKIYPLSGGLSKTMHAKGILKEDEIKVIDGITNVLKFLKKPNPKVKFLDVTFCKGGCIGGPLLTNKLSIEDRKKRVMKYMNVAKKEPIPKGEEGVVEKAKGIKFSS